MMLAYLKSRFASRVPEKDRVPFWQKVAYGAGNPVENLTVWMPMAVLTPVFNIGLGMNPATLGIILAIWRAYDAFADPVMGNISDNTRTRWGRRRPYIVIGAILTGLIMPFIWWVPHGLSENMLFAWLLIGGLCLYTSFTVWAMPYYSLQLEMTPDYNERTNVSAYRTFFGQFFGLLGGWILAIAALDVFSTTPGEPNLVNGMRYVGIIMGVLIIVLGVLPGLFTQERYYAAEASKQEKQQLWKSLKQTLTTRPFLMLVLIAATQIVGVGLVSTLGFYVNAYYVCGGDVTLATKVQGGITTALYVPGFLCIPICLWISNRFGKRMLLYFVMTLGVVGYLSVYLCMRPGMPWLQVIPALIISPVSVGLWMIVPSMQADVADYDEVNSHARREGSFSSIFSWTTKLAWTLNTGLSGFVLVWTGFNVDVGGEQPEKVLHNMLHCYALIPVACFLATMFFVSRYELTQQKMQEIRNLLEARRGTVTVAGI